MEFHEVNAEHAPVVQGYGPGFFRIAGQVIEGGVLAIEQDVRPWGGFDDLEALRSLEGQLDVLFIGTGPEIAHLPAPVQDVLEAAKIPYELMASPTACRSYNVLLPEGRRVGLAAVPV